MCAKVWQPSKESRYQRDCWRYHQRSTTVRVRVWFTRTHRGLLQSSRVFCATYQAEKAFSKDRGIQVEESAHSPPGGDRGHLVTLMPCTFPSHPGILPSTIQNKLRESHRGFMHDNKAETGTSMSSVKTQLIAPSRSIQSFLSRLCQRKCLIHSFAVWQGRKFVHLDMSWI